MRVISKRKLREFWASSSQYKDAQSSLEVWHDETLKAKWKNPQQIKAQFRSASILKITELCSILQETSIG